MKRTSLPPFEHRMSGTQRILGWCWLPVYMFALPVLAAMYNRYALEPWDALTANSIYFGIGAAFVLIVLGTYLRRDFDVLCDAALACVTALLMAILVEYALSLPMALILILIEENFVNPNNEFVMAMAEGAEGAVMALAVFIGPLVEEPLFRGVVFGSIRRRSRLWAYIVSIALFSLLHVWQYAFLYSDVSLLLYAVQYIPISFALAWCYERTSCIWVPVFFHMLQNFLSYMMLSMM